MGDAKVPVVLQEEPRLTAEQIDALPPGQTFWWLRHEHDFVRLPKRVRGDQKLDLLVHLEPGRYVLGVGSAANGVRRTIEVAASASTTPAPAAAPKKVDLEGKTFVLTGDLDAMDRDAAAAWLTERGAKVSSSVSGKTSFLVAGRDPGPKKLEKAAELRIRVLSEADLRDELGFPAAGSPQAPAKATGKEKVDRLVKGLKKFGPDETKKIESLVGPDHFRDLGLVEHELWGISVGPRGGAYLVHIDLDDRPQFGMRCNCREWHPCRHCYALLFTAHRHFVPPAPAPEGHREAARYVPTYE